MPTPEQLSADQRRIVAKACGDPVGAAVLNPNWYHEYKINYKALVSTVAQMIEALPESSMVDHEHKFYWWERFGKATATNNTPQIEGLAFELIEGGKG